MKAMPMTPCATARIVAVESPLKLSPRSRPMTRSKMARLPRVPASPYAIKIPATMNDARNCRMPRPMLATVDSAVRARTPIFGCMLSTRPGRSQCAFDQKP